MNMPSSAVSSSPVSNPSLNTPLFQRSRLKGKIYNVRRINNFYYTQIIAPALDEYSHPSKFGLKSTSRLGETDQLISVDVSITGSTREYAYTDKETGERKTGFDNTVYFDVIE